MYSKYISNYLRFILDETGHLNKTNIKFNI